MRKACDRERRRMPALRRKILIEIHWRGAGTGNRTRVKGSTVPKDTTTPPRPCRRHHALVVNKRCRAEHGVFNHPGTMSGWFSLDARAATLPEQLTQCVSLQRTTRVYFRATPSANCEGPDHRVRRPVRDLSTETADVGLREDHKSCCAECGGPLIHVSGCIQCLSCGESRCGG